MSGPVVRDETGLHATECECLECENGFRPSPMQRHYAAEQLKRRKLAADVVEKRPSKEELRRAERRRRAAEEAKRRAEEERRWRTLHAPLSREQIEQLEALKRAEFPALAGRVRR